MRMFMNKIKKSDEMFDLYYFILQQQMRSKLSNDCEPFTISDHICCFIHNSTFT